MRTSDIRCFDGSRVIAHVSVPIRARHSIPRIAQGRLIVGSPTYDYPTARRTWIRYALQGRHSKGRVWALEIISRRITPVYVGGDMVPSARVHRVHSVHGDIPTDILEDINSILEATPEKVDHYWEMLISMEDTDTDTDTVHLEDKGAPIALPKAQLSYCGACCMLHVPERCTCPSCGWTRRFTVATRLKEDHNE